MAQLLRAAARRVGVARVFPQRAGQGTILDDHLPFIRQGVPSIDLIDFDFACFHRTCDDLSVISVRSLDAVGETVLADCCAASSLRRHRLYPGDA